MTRLTQKYFLIKVVVYVADIDIFDFLNVQFWDDLVIFLKIFMVMVEGWAELRVIKTLSIRNFFWRKNTPELRGKTEECEGIENIALFLSGQFSTLRSNGNSMFFSLRNISRTRYFHLNFLIRIFKILSLLIINLFMEITQPDPRPDRETLTSRNS